MPDAGKVSEMEMAGRKRRQDDEIEEKAQSVSALLVDKISRVCNRR